MATCRAERFSLSRTLECGQFFRWMREGEGYVVHAAGRSFHVRQEGDRLHAEGVDAPFLRRFFALDHDAAAIEGALRRDPVLREAVKACSGLRILRQDPWECTAAFILSIVSNIPRITRNVADIARVYGPPSRAFPRPSELGDEAGLRSLRVGFRAKYLVEAARRAELLETIGRLPYEAAKQELLTIPGVADKVADCILLYAYGRLNAFPVDTWIRKVMTKLCFRGRRTPDRKIRECAAARWGDLAGYAQQFLFVWSREYISARPRGASRA